MALLTPRVKIFTVLNIKYTDRIISSLSSLGAMMIGVIALFGMFRAFTVGISAGSTFIFWALVTAFVAFLSGMALGLLFGLPSARQVDTSASGGASTGYVESTSLEQIADFLVKGLVALSLTSFSIWVGKFDTLAANVTATLMGTPLACVIGQPACFPDRVPGGLLIAGFALQGFLIAYLWMRRWFISEMETARGEALDIVRKQKQQFDAARSDNRTGRGASSSNDTEQQTKLARSIAQAATTSATEGAAKEAAQEVKDKLKAAPGGDPDDPWKGVFGGLTAFNNHVLSANITPLVSDPDYFQLDLLVTIDPEKRAELAGKAVHYYLHPTFGSEPRDIPITADGKAALQLFSWGAFTVGVIVDDGTRLELDLAQAPGAPQKFIER